MIRKKKKLFVNKTKNNENKKGDSRICIKHRRRH